MQCDVGMVFLGRRERVSMEEASCWSELCGAVQGDVDREDDLGDAVSKLKIKAFRMQSYALSCEEDDVPELSHVSLKAEHKAAALQLARVARRSSKRGDFSSCF